MAQTIIQLLGTNATLTSGTLTIQLADLKDANNAVYLASPNTASPTKAVAAVLAYLTRITTGKSTDETAGIAAADFQTDKSFVNRNGIGQILQPFTINCYRADTNATFDPDDVI
jgi:hypothetical protein